MQSYRILWHLNCIRMVTAMYISSVTILTLPTSFFLVTTVARGDWLHGEDLTKPQKCLNWGMVACTEMFVWTVQQCNTVGVNLISKVSQCKTYLILEQRNSSNLVPKSLHHQVFDQLHCAKISLMTSWEKPAGHETMPKWTEKAQFISSHE